MAFKFEKLEVWKLALDYLDMLYDIAALLPTSENFNLRSQLTRAGTSISLAIAEGSTGQTDAEQARFLGISIRSAIESVACLHVIHRRRYVVDTALMRRAYTHVELLVGKLTGMRRKLDPDEKWLREEALLYNALNDERPGQSHHPFDAARDWRDRGSDSAQGAE